MAGSYNHVIKKSTGELRSPGQVLSMLDCSSGDVYEAIEEMYGMIWHLGYMLAGDYTTRRNPDAKAVAAEFIEEARDNYKQGLIFSPTKRFKE